MGQIRAVVFDLDNVLYDETDYIFAAYREIAAFLSNKCGLPSSEIYSRLVSDFQKKTSMYPRLFNDFVADLGLGQEVVPEILRIYVSVSPKLSIYSEAEDVLRRLGLDGVKLGLLTNGNVATQRNKVELLGLEKFFDAVVFARERGREYEKPNPEAYRVVLRALRVLPEESVCVGDNPHTDFLGARQLGLKSVRLLRGEFRDVRLGAEYEADITVESLTELLGVLGKV